MNNEYIKELKSFSRMMSISETLLISIFSHIPNKKVEFENTFPLVRRSGLKLIKLLMSMDEFKSLPNEVYEIMPSLQEAGQALSEGIDFSIDEVEAQLEKADQRYLEIIESLNEKNKRHQQNRAIIFGMRAVIASIKFCYDDAENFYNKQIECYKESVGENHLDLALSYNYLAINFYEQGKYDAAESFLRKSLKIREIVLGQDHLDTAKNYNNLACSLQKQGKSEEAVDLYNKSADIFVGVLGYDDFFAQISRDNVANFLEYGENAHCNEILL